MIRIPVYFTDSGETEPEYSLYKTQKPVQNTGFYCAQEKNDIREYRSGPFGLLSDGIDGIR